MAKIRSLEPVCTYNFIFRVTKKSFPKGKTIDWYQRKLEKKLKVKQLYGGYEDHGRYSLYLGGVSDRNARRIRKIIATIDDGLLREVVESEKIVRYS